MRDLFDLETMKSDAVISGPDDCYRYELQRSWDVGAYVLVVCMLNPSTADYRLNDPTILTLLHFARAWRYGGLHVVNLYAFRSSSPSALWTVEDPVGPLNDAHIDAAIAYARRTSGEILVGWGTNAAGGDRAEWFIQRARAANVKLVCLGKTLEGFPKHPMARGRHRIPRDQKPMAWEAA